MSAFLVVFSVLAALAAYYLVTDYLLLCK